MGGARRALSTNGVRRRGRGQRRRESPLSVPSSLAAESCGAPLLMVALPPRRSLTPPPNVNEPRSEEILTSFLRPPRVRLPHEHSQRRINSNFGGPSSIIVEGIKEDNVEETMGAKVARKEID